MKAEILRMLKSTAGGILSILEGRYERIVSYLRNKKKSSVAGG